jgi:hypothetical protein
MKETLPARHIVLNEWFYPRPFGEAGEPVFPPAKAALKVSELEDELTRNPRPAPNETLSIRIEQDVRDGREGFIVQKVLTRIYMNVDFEEGV